MTPGVEPQEQIHLGEDIFRLMVESAADGMCVVDAKGGILFCNQRMLELLGRTVEETNGHSLTEFLEDDSVQAFLSAREKRKAGIRETYELTFVRKDGSLLYTITSAGPIVNKTGNFIGALGVITDITEREIAKRALADQQVRSIAYSKMSALGEMAGGMAHEVNNPLAVIQLNAELLKEVLKGNSPDLKAVGAMANTIARTTERIAKIIQGLKSFSRNADGDPLVASSLVDVVKNTLVFCEQKFRHAQVEIQYGVMSPTKVSCRPVQISQVLLNLLNNSFDAISEDVKEKWIKIEINEEPISLTMIVTDSGHGIAPSLREQIFEPFFTTKETGKGTGLGLSISQGIMSTHGGALTLDSSGPNTRFVLTFQKPVG